MSTVPVTEVDAAGLPSVAARVHRLDDEVHAHDGHGALGDAVWRDLERPAPESAGFLAGEGGEAGYAHVARIDTQARDDWTVSVAVHPAARASGTRAALLDAALRHVGAHGGGRVILWIAGGGDTDDGGDLRAAGFRRSRELYEMRVELPLHEAARYPTGTSVRTFVPGADDAAWIALNNRAFAGHPEQGGWVADTLTRRTAEPWFDPTLFLLAFDGEGLAGFNWLKVHEAKGEDPHLGEIFVIGVDPRAAGKGLGRALAIDGLDALARRGVTTGSLFVAAENDRAARLYRRLGFTVHRVDRAYECVVGSS